MSKEAVQAYAKKEFLVDPQKVKELQRLLKTRTEDEAIRKAVEESVTNHRLTRSLNRFLDALAKEQTAPPQ